VRIDFVTIFPDLFEDPLRTSMMGRAYTAGIVEFGVLDFRQFTINKHKSVDDSPYGGGAGMVLCPDPIFRAVESLSLEGVSSRVILTCPQGELFTQRKAEALAEESHLIFICGHYEGYDERIREHLVTDEISIGDYVLTGGELPALVVSDAVVRLLPGVLGNESSAAGDSFATGLLEHPHYTRPYEYRGWRVPDILLSGHHANIEAWRREQSLRRTWLRRKELLATAALSEAEKRWIERWESEVAPLKET